MRFINTRMHGILDYFFSIVLICSPWLLGFYKDGAETWVPVTLGAMGIIYSLFTDYQYGAVRVLSMRKHLWIDILSGFFLAASPWVFNFSDHVYVPHVIFGLLEIAIAIMTDPLPTRRTDTSISEQHAH
jgi:hypothetical protein